MTERILSISGLRGVIGSSLEPEYLARFAAAYGTFCSGGKIILSRDGRASGEMVRSAVLSGLIATGCRVIDAGICATPTCGVLVTAHEAAGALQITASHNPIEWNGLKPFSAQGSVLSAEEGARFLEIIESGDFSYQPHDKLGQLSVLPTPFAAHEERIRSLVDVTTITEKKFKVVLDCSHGAGAVAGPAFLRSLGCEVVVLGGEPDGQFEHPPEPLEQNLGELCEVVQKENAAVGFAQDPDADRLAIVDNTGRYIGEELTLALAVDWVLRQRTGPVVVNGSTSRVSADIATKYGVPFSRSAVGEANVVQQMQEVSATIGGEGNGGVIEPQVGWVRDSFVSMAYVLAGLAQREGTLTDWVAELPHYAIVKDKIACEREKAGVACETLQAEFPEATSTEGDGLRLDWNDRWVQVRASNTEPIIRIIAEAPTATAAEALAAQAKTAISKIL